MQNHMYTKNLDFQQFEIFKSKIMEDIYRQLP